MTTLAQTEAMLDVMVEKGLKDKVQVTNRENPPDAILREVFLRTGDRPFWRIEDVISREEMLEITGGYKRVAGYDLETLRAGARAG